MALKKIAITTGDLKGIGLEVTVKALVKLGPVRDVVYCVFCSAHLDAYATKLLDQLKSKFNVLIFSDPKEAFLYQEVNSKHLLLICTEASPAHWVVEAAQACLSGKAVSMTTGPLSKPQIIKAGFKDLGHTDILKRITGSNNAFMAFLGRHFNVLLVTGHIPISKVSTALTEKRLKLALGFANDFRRRLPKHQQKLPLGLLGLNPHSGDGGLIGLEETLFFSNSQQMFDAVGPLVPDAAFLKSNWKKYSFYIACYHDQGLIPFKVVHGFDSGVHLTLGLPIWRTSVDHGTAFDIYGKDKASPGSMIEAIRWAIHLGGCNV